MKTTLIIAVYKRNDFLEKVLASVERQSLLPAEIIIAEDGSDKTIDETVKKWKSKTSLSIKHFTHKDSGNRKTLAINRAVKMATSEYLIFIDGDCVLHKDFVKAHCDFSQEKYFLTGRRVELSVKASNYLTVDRIKNGYLEKFPLRLYLDALIGKTHLCR
jgi:glycosyltransferase involved in cell wall biosynthesis